ncbi:MAG: hypothetical protein ABSE17_02420 [Candidatus Levyibacteriota bacterium]
MKRLTQNDLKDLKNEFKPLIGLKISWLSIPLNALPGFEPSQIAVITNTILDAALPQMELLLTDEENKKKVTSLGLSKYVGAIGQRETYPDYLHKSGKRVELKGLFVDNAELNLKRPPTKREQSARIKGNITISNIQPD